jgi:hypothetical protein
VIEFGATTHETSQTEDKRHVCEQMKISSAIRAYHRGERSDTYYHRHQQPERHILASRAPDAEPDVHRSER